LGHEELVHQERAKSPHQPRASMLGSVEASIRINSQ